MRRTDRLFELIQILRDGRLHRASEMAERLEVSVRTIWRDMATLMASGLPVEGERGVGYILRAPITLPPMILTPPEMEALRLGVRLVAEGADPGLARAARGLAAKIAAVVPAPATPEPDDLFVYSADETQRAAPHLPVLRQAIRARQRLAITYIDPQGAETHRDIRPLQLEFWGRVWTLAAFCEARGDFRSFRVDRIVAITETGETYPDEPGRRLEDYRARIAAELTPADAPETRNSDPAGS
ncbi:YafY family transcriptional regulator [Gemmobacter lutimaris]|uniref:YafY family transcriptional regulator n=1 Tax=Gemmobacter lutimaris TaxID=2306023 RepID=A0A398BYB6_9RHOB|nr:YafY family protein [Gemmobacter lutimaris]RID93851.1 YafY family transcriptional regulator [Gemmobacter lutimaris]